MSDDKYDDLTDSLLDAVPAHDPGTDSESDPAEIVDEGDRGGTVLVPTGSDPSPLDALLSSLPSDAREVVRRLAVDHQLPADDPLWAYIGVTGSIQTLLERAERAAEAQREQIIGAARAEIERTREEASGAIAESLAEAQKTLVTAAAREVAALETSARTAVANVTEDLRRQSRQMIQELRAETNLTRTPGQVLTDITAAILTPILSGIAAGAILTYMIINGGAGLSLVPNEGADLWGWYQALPPQSQSSVRKYIKDLYRQSQPRKSSRR